MTSAVQTTDIVLATLNARYPHSAFGLRYLLANLGPLAERTRLLEWGIQDRTVDLIDQLVKFNPRILGLGVYIWNIDIATRLVVELKQILPDLIIILGGPEVSYEWESQPIVDAADFLITGEADFAFRELCEQVLSGTPPTAKVIAADIPQFGQLSLPYSLYNAEDIAQRVIYVEASRGCPFTCEFCLSALEIPVRAAALQPFLDAMQGLLDRGARQFKFVDRTFNLNLRFSQAILEFFLKRYSPGMFLHFEMIPDRLPDPLRQLILRFPAGVLQFEIGVQTFNEDVGQLISRRQDNEQLAANFRFLRASTGVHLHADLIAGLPGEDLESFATGFDRLVQLDPHEIQVGMLKRLRGTPLIRHEENYQLIYSPYAPYEILCTRDIDFATMHRLRRFARYWDLIGNSGHFVESRRLIWQNASPFWTFLELADELFARTGRTHGIALTTLYAEVFHFLVQRCEESNSGAQIAAEAIWRDYLRQGREDRPAFLNGYVLPPAPPRAKRKLQLPQRQARHADD